MVFKTNIYQFINDSAEILLTFLLTEQYNWTELVLASLHQQHFVHFLQLSLGMVPGQHLLIIAGSLLLVILCFVPCIRS